LMNRMYMCTEYLRLVSRIRSFIPSVSLSTDIIAGFPTETAEDHQRTLDVLREVEYDGAFTFRYSPRENTKAWHLGDDVSEEVKIDRLNEIIEAQRGVSYRRNQRLIGQTVEVLVEGESRKSTSDLSGRTDTNKTVVFPRGDAQIGHYLNITIERANSATLFGRPVLQARQGYGHSKLAANG